MKPIILLLFLLITSSGYACEMIYGTWVSDKNKSIEYYKETGIKHPLSMEFMQQALGIMTVTYDKTSYKQHASGNIDVELNGVSSPFSIDGFKADVEYLNCNKVSVETKYLDPSGEEIISKYNFVNSKTYWVDMKIFKGREYFSKQ